MDDLFDVAVIGGGGAGQMAMLRSVLNHLKTIVFLGDSRVNKKSRATWVSEVDNIPGMFGIKNPITKTSRGVIKFIENHDDLKSFLTLLKKSVLRVEKKDEIFELSTKEENYRARFIILCTGTMDVQPKINGSIESILPFANLMDVLYCIRCDGHRTVGHDCAVIGHGSGAGWISVMLKERYQLSNLYVLTHGETFVGSDDLKKQMDQYGIKIVDDEIKKVLGDPKKGLEGFLVGENEIRVTKSFVALGSIVYNDLAKQVDVDLSEDGHILVGRNGETSVEGFYAVGDIAHGKKKQVYTAWDMAVDAIDSVDEKIRILKRNNPN